MKKYLVPDLFVLLAALSMVIGLLVYYASGLSFFFVMAGFFIFLAIYIGLKESEMTEKQVIKNTVKAVLVEIQEKKEAKEND